MIWFKRTAFVLAIPLLLMCVYAVLSSTMEYSRMQSEVRALGPIKGQLDQLQSDTIQRWTTLAAGMAAVPFIIIGIFWWFRRPTPEPEIARPPILALAAQRVVPVSAGSTVWRVCLVVLCLLCNTLDTLIPVYEKSEKALKVVRENEQRAQQEWQTINDVFLALVARKDDAAMKLVEIVDAKTKLLTKARGERELEELVLEKILHEVTFYKRLARQAAPWHIITTENE